MADAEWERLSYDDKNYRLYLEQRKTLDLFLERGAITQEQYDNSLRDLTEKMSVKGHALTSEMPEN